MATRLCFRTCMVGCVVVFLWAVVGVCEGGRTRFHYIGAVEEEWDYAPGGDDRTLEILQAQSARNDQQQSQSARYLQSGPARVGRRYLKAMYREFTDGNFTHRTNRSSWMGLLGPVIGGDQGDELVIVFRNMAVNSGRNFSLHLPGLKRLAGQNEVAVAEDDEEGVAPGQEVTYRWKVSRGVSPTSPHDPPCISRAYHSHVSTDRDVSSGLVGVLLTCKPGQMENVADMYDRRQFAVLFHAFDENKSWYIDHNIRNYLNLTSHQSLKQDPEFQESNKMHGVNGLMYGHLPGLDACVDDHSLWHLVSLGSEQDFHSSVGISGHPFLVNQRRVDAVSLGPGSDALTATLTAQTAGQWPLQSRVLGHAEGGMTAFFNVGSCGQRDSLAGLQQFRRHYLAIEELDWNYAPSGRNLFDRQDLLPPNSFSEQYFGRGRQVLYRKAVFREYEDVTFSRETRRGADDEEGQDHLGFLGPALRVEVGDLLVLTLRNDASAGRAFSFHPQGARPVRLFGQPPSSSNSQAVEPGQVKTTYWLFPESMGPGPEDPPCLSRLYTSSSQHAARDAHSGLVGPLLVCRRGALDRFGRQRQVDREFFLMFSATDENLSWYSDVNIGRQQVDRNANRMHGLNGFVYGNLPGLNACQGDRVSWHVLSVAGSHESHESHVLSPYFHGQSVTSLLHHSPRSSSSPLLSLLPGDTATLFMKADNPGEWAVVDLTSQHYSAGAKAVFRVRDCRLRRTHDIDVATPSAIGGRPANRTYFLQAEEQLWDFAPKGVNPISGKNLTDPDGESYLYTRNDGQYQGTQYQKVRYVQYTDNTFATPVQRPEEEEYLGILGPVIMAETYDVITVVFRNNASSRAYSIHAQGLSYTKESEGSPYAGGPGAVMPGQDAVYTWSVPPDVAPAEDDPACVTMPYYSAVNPVRDVNSGLVGPLVICKPGTVDADTGARADVDSAFVLLLHAFDEGQSWYQQPASSGVGGAPAANSSQDPTLAQSNLMHSINGRVEANGPPLEAALGSNVAVHVMTLAQQADIHTLSVQAAGHGEDLAFQAHPQRQQQASFTTDILRLMPGDSLALLVNASLPGSWTLRGHVAGQVTGDMQMAAFDVPALPVASTTLLPFGAPIDAN